MISKEVRQDIVESINGEIQTSANFEEGTIEKVTAKQVKINGTRHAGHKCIKISKRRKHYGNTDENTDEETN